MHSEEIAKELPNEPSYRSKQIYEWLHKKLVTSFEDMSNLPKSLIQNLNDNFYISAPTVLNRLISEDGTVKFLFDFGSGVVVETVLMTSNYGYSICVSSQVGCKMGCTFCASHIGGWEKNLSSSQILAQVYHAQRDLEARLGKENKIGNLVLMGIGEPLDNYDNVLKFIRMLSDEYGQNLSQRSITLSTCGLVDKIYKLADEGLAITLAISLHAPDDDTRKKTMPIAKVHSMESLFKAANYYFEKTGRRISYEYAMIAGINDSELQAKTLGTKLSGNSVHFNLIPLNPVTEAHLQKAPDANIRGFAKTLEKFGIEVTVRRNQGTDINAACGQLRRTRNETGNNRARGVSNGYKILRS
ncbi:MAG: 23S rRNA (adenine(2503)-C(2))-methyltransferase RlmN [Defluviitaleaceae bacterium]|nr:23S rRNA (adenine(2503)-C(2))-methyltransferase RlmN [Defluviitaleaceae bacterium]